MGKKLIRWPTCSTLRGPTTRKRIGIIGTIGTEDQKAERHGI
jgi:hypothetical protein